MPDLRDLIADAIRANGTDVDYCQECGLDAHNAAVDVLDVLRANRDAVLSELGGQPSDSGYMRKTVWEFNNEEGDVS